MEQRVRIINDKGQVKYVSKHIADNTKLLKMYGFIKQDFEKKEEKDLVPVLNYSKTEADPKIIGWVEKEERDLSCPQLVQGLEELGELTDGDILIKEQPMTEEQAREKYFELFGKKAGNKKLETILTEIQEKLTIQ
jgi:hypothetical protein